MFKDLRTSTKLVVLCGTFIIALVATTYSLVAEKQIAIEFARKELIGTEYLTAVRGAYALVLTSPPIEASTTPTNSSTDDILKRLAAAQGSVGAQLQTDEFYQALATAIRQWASDLDGVAAYASALDVLTGARQLIMRIADDSNLALDPDLDSYHLQDLVTRKLPAFLRHLGEVQILIRRSTVAGAISNEPMVDFQILQGLLRSSAAELTGDLAAAYRGNADGRLKRTIDDAFSSMLSNTSDYLDLLHASVIDNNSVARNAGASNRRYRNVVEIAVKAWGGAQAELENLLRKRTDSLVDKMRLSLALTGVLAGLSIIIAVMTHRHIVGPLERLENVATKVRETKDYSLRIDYTSKNEIGQLTAAFNDMLSELAAAREHERAEQSEFMRVARLTTMGAMTASIAHEINQPLAAIAASSNAAKRWLSRTEPDLDEARSALGNIARDAHRASEVIGSVRAMFKKVSGEKTPLAVNEIVKDVLTLVQGEIRRQRISVRTESLRDLPHVVGDRTQLLQVFMNLIRNAVEAMGSVADRERLLVVRSELHDARMVMITVSDSGMGIEPNNMERIFEAFYTTKSDGMGMGLSICRSIIEAHGGRLWASPGPVHGSVFHVALPSSE